MSEQAGGLWEFWIDRGGTFTDVIARSADGGVETYKVLSENAEHYADAAVEGVRRAMGLAKGEPIPGEKIAAVKMGTTVATNALLERKGAPTAFVTTKGFGDAMVIGDQTRPDIFALNINRAAPLQDWTVEIDERIGADGDIVSALNEDAAREALRAALEAGARSAAVCLVNAYQNPAHEESVAAIAREIGFAHVSAGMQVDPRIKFVPRARTTLADAYLTPVLRKYVAQVVDALGGAPVFFMTSAGGLVSADAFRGRDALLSGPAGGVVGMARTARASGYDKVIGFDMGGTSTDVSRYDGDDYERSDEAEINGWKVRAPMMAVHTVAAGGGSVLTFDGERARVGPKSAGADPGPAAYGLGGPLTVTDANVLLGRVDARFFPEVFGSSGDRPLNVEIVRRRFAQLAYSMNAPSPEAAAEGFLDVAVESMAQAVKKISIAQGCDPAQYALQSFGGAGGQVACRIADALGMTSVLVHPMASVLSALGVGLADMRVWREAPHEGALDTEGLAQAERAMRQLEGQARGDLIDQGAVADEIATRTQARLRYAGADTVIPIPFAALAGMRAEFEAAHKRLFGFAETGRDIAIESLAAEARATPPGARDVEVDAPNIRGGPTPTALARLYMHGAWTPAPVFELDAVGAGRAVYGPALIVEPTSQIVVERGWRAERNGDGMMVIERFETRRRTGEETSSADPVRLELFNKRFMSVAEQMGVTLEKTAHSVNIKERLDFSCAVFDADGGLVANAPHMPVHLGSMSSAVRAALKHQPDLREGDAVALNNPYDGGTHVPDVTVVAPVHDPDTGARLFFVAARGHHADIGGVEPGSMPPFSTRIAEEGVIFEAQKILDAGVFDERAVRATLLGGAYPARNPERNIADLKAQLAACMRGAEELHRLVEEHGRHVVSEYMGHVQDNAEAAVRRVIGALSDGAVTLEMDDGAKIAVRIEVNRENRSAIVDFNGTSAQRPSNLNAPAAVARAAVIYVFRSLADDDIPLNEGCLKPLEIRIPRGSMLDPEPPAAVVAGNVETSQHVVDALFLAAGALAASQGTMNNLTFGDQRRQYYETICGGAGASPDADGASAVHTHMTNSRLTDVEVLEARFPVRLEAFAVRAGSGGAGRRRGGDGAVRRLRFLEPMTVALLSSRRLTEPPGLKGGQNGACGVQRLLRADRTSKALEGRFRIDMAAGDAIEVETPGGGGCGEID